MGLKSQLIYQARLAEFPRSALPRDPQAACRWLFQPGLFIGTNLTNPRKGLHERGLEPTAPAHLGEGLQSRCREEEEEGRTAGMLLSEHARLQSCYSSRGRGAGETVLPSLSVDPRGAAGG